METNKTKTIEKLHEHKFPNLTFYDGLYSHHPSLSELIEACGDLFLGLRNETGFWSATGFPEGNRKAWFTENGKTPEEAVANLWLELNKK